MCLHNYIETLFVGTTLKSFSKQILYTISITIHILTIIIRRKSKTQMICTLIEEVRIVLHLEGAFQFSIFGFWGASNSVSPLCHVKLQLFFLNHFLFCRFSSNFNNFRCSIELQKLTSLRNSGFRARYFQIIGNNSSFTFSS